MEFTIPPPCEAIARLTSKPTQNYQEPGLCVFGPFLVPSQQKKMSVAIFHRFPSERPWLGHNGPPQKRADSQFTHSQSTTPPPIPAGPGWRKDREIDAEIDREIENGHDFSLFYHWKLDPLPPLPGGWGREDTPSLYKVSGRYDYKKTTAVAAAAK